MRFGEGEILDDGLPDIDPALPTRPRTKKAAAPAPAPEPELAPPVPMLPPKRTARPLKPGRAPERLKLRPLQQVIRDSTARFKVPCVHRRFGKTVESMDWLIDCCVPGGCDLPNPRAYYVATTYKAAKLIGWTILKDLVKDMNVKLSEWELSCYFKDTGAKLQFLSSTQYQSHRGIYADRICLDEASLQPPSAWTMVFRPALADRHGLAQFISTPQGKGFFYKLWKHAKTAENWESWLYTVDDTGIIPEDELKDLRATMPAHQYKQEMLCDFDIARMGAFFGAQMNSMDDAGRIRKVEFIPELPVVASWYMPKTDGAVVLFFQQAGEDLHCIDAIWKQQTTIAELAREVSEKPFQVQRNYASAKNEVDHYASRISQARGMGLRFKLANELPLMDGIYAAKPLLERAHFDETLCEDTTEALRQFHSTYDEVRECFEEKPFQDWTQDFAGALITFAAAHNPRRSDWSKPLNYPNRRAA